MRLMNSPIPPEELLRGALEELAEYDRRELMARPSNKIIPRRRLELLADIEELKKLVRNEKGRETADRRRDGAGAVKDFKARAVVDGRMHCEACSFSHPMPDATRVIQCHHVVPVAMGGSNEPSNLVIICSNCHAIAHAIIDREGVVASSRLGFLSRLKTVPA